MHGYVPIERARRGKIGACGHMQKKYLFMSRFLRKSGTWGKVLYVYVPKGRQREEKEVKMGHGRVVLYAYVPRHFKRENTKEKEQTRNRKNDMRESI